MDKLPTKILHKIFIQLDLKQRLICLRVCRSWWSALEKHSLFYSVEISRENNHFKRILYMFEQLPERAAQVEVLDIKTSPYSFFPRPTLFNIFPNVRVMRMSEYKDKGQPVGVGPRGNIHLTHSNSKIEYLSDFLHCELFSQILFSNIGGVLETVNLDLSFRYYLTSMVSEAKNLPVLRKLTLHRLCVKIDDFENLHKNIPSIQDFSIESMTLIDSNLPSNIIPAASITKFTFNFDRPRNTIVYARFYQYIESKYVNVANLVGCTDTVWAKLPYQIRFPFNLAL